MARKKHRKKKAHKRKKSSVGKRARKYYVSVKRNKKYRHKRKKRGPGKQMQMFGKPRYRVRHTVKRVGKRRKSRHHSIGALIGAHHSIVG